MKKNNLKKNKMVFPADLKSRIKSFSCTPLILLLLILSPAFLFAQQKTITGQVKNESNIPVAASVTIKGSTVGTTTDANGNFSIQAAAGAKIIISAAEFSPQEFIVGKNNIINATLVRTDKALTEVVVVGYGIQKKTDVTGSVSRVNLESMQNTPNTNIGQFLQGTVPGLNVGLSTFAGGTPPISIRGRVTLGGNQNVLIILDGIQYGGSLSSINPDDISSIDILKDASSTAVYGAAGANGVILITSKKGKYNQKTKIAFSSAYTTQNPTTDLRPLNHDEYLEQFKDAFYTQAFNGPDYLTPNPSFNVASVMDPTMVNATRTAVLPNNFDWWSAGVKKGTIAEDNLSLSGGGDKVTYLLSGGIVNQKGYIINDLFKRKTIRANLEIKPFSWWKVGLVSSGSFVNQDGAEPSLGNLTIASPVLVPFDTAGNVIPYPTNTIVPNPFNTFYVDDYERHQYYFANIYSDLDIPFIKGLNYRINYGHNLRDDQHYYSSKFDGGLTGRAYKDNQQVYDYTFDNILSYTKKYRRHDLTATALYGAREGNFSRTFAEGIGFARLNLGYNDLGSATTKNLTTNANSEAYNYQMGRINYKFNDKYLLTATIRRDGYSGFAKNFKYATFPSVALGWIISNEKFMENIKAVNFLKLRAGYGSIGTLTQKYKSLSQVGTNTSYVFGDGGPTSFGQQVNTLYSPNLRWEKTTGINFGADFTLLSNRLTGNLEYYNTNTTDLLFDVAIPGVTGFLTAPSNIGKINNVGYEAGLTYKIINTKDFNWSSTFNFWANTNKIKRLLGQDLNGDGIEDDLVSSGLFIGRPIQAIFDYKAGPIYQLTDTRLPGFQVGSLSVLDNDKSGTITSDDRVFIGKQEPAYRFSFYNSVSYKNFSFSFFINSVQGGKDGYLANNMRIYYRDDNAVRNNELNGVNFWSPRNPTGEYPRITSGSHSTVEPNVYKSRSFVRLQDVSLSYALPKSVLNKIKATGVSFYVSGKNLATWTKWKGWDPESLYPNSSGNQVPDGLALDGRPALKAITVGVHINY
jgi:TonB-linked SusC/RagA family outer membrane protein